MQLSLSSLLKYIVDEASFINQHIKTKTMSYNDFANNSLLKRAIGRSLEVIGEASEQLQFSFKTQHPHICWKEFVEIKDALMQRYFDVDFPLIYNICVSKISGLQSEVNAIILLQEKAMDHS